jgi:hypothetical protein
VLTITKPDATTVAQSGPWTWTQISPGQWQTFFDYTLPTPGLFRFAWVTTGPGTAPTPIFENVRFYISAVGLNEMKNHLNKKSLTDDDELASFMMASTELVENKVGIIVPRAFTDRVEGSRHPMQLVVPQRPVLSVQSVASALAGGPVWDNVASPGVLAADTEAGLIYQPSGFQFWWGPWDVAYTCGRQVVDERFIHAVKEQVRHLWETQRGSQPPTVLQGEEVYTSTTGFTFSVPRRVLELLEQDTVPSS